MGSLQKPSFSGDSTFVGLTRMVVVVWSGLFVFGADLVDLAKLKLRVMEDWLKKMVNIRLMGCTWWFVVG